MKSAYDDLKCLALGSVANVSEWNTFPLDINIIHKGLTLGAGDYCNVITPAFSEWFFSSSYFDMPNFHQFEIWLDDKINRNQQVPDGFYTIPGELSSWRVSHEASPSLIHKHYSEEEQWKCIRPENTE